jgi:hypothetical protein
MPPAWRRRTLQARARMSSSWMAMNTSTHTRAAHVRTPHDERPRRLLKVALHQQGRARHKTQRALHNVAKHAPEQSAVRAFASEAVPACHHGRPIPAFSQGRTVAVLRAFRRPDAHLAGGLPWLLVPAHLALIRPIRVRAPHSAKQQDSTPRAYEAHAPARRGAARHGRSGLLARDRHIVVQATPPCVRAGCGSRSMKSLSSHQILTAVRY